VESGFGNYFAQGMVKAVTVGVAACFRIDGFSVMGLCGGQRVQFREYCTAIFLFLEMKK
jgi:hypothetical protein